MSFRFNFSKENLLFITNYLLVKYKVGQCIRFSRPVLTTKQVCLGVLRSEGCSWYIVIIGQAILDKYFPWRNSFWYTCLCSRFGFGESENMEHIILLHRYDQDTYVYACSNVIVHILMKKTEFWCVLSNCKSIYKKFDCTIWWKLQKNERIY